MTILDPGYVAKALGGEASGNRVNAPGPGHSPKDRSLGLLIDPDAPDGFVVHSFSGDDPMEAKDYVRGRLGLPEWRPALKPKTAARKPLAAVVCRYEYQDETGEPYLRVNRHADKTFTQYHWNIDSWAAKAPKGPRIPYRLPQIIANPDATIWLVEGEKDADRLASLGLIATTAPGGSNAINADVARWLDGQPVVALPDNDKAGREWAEKVANLLPDATIVTLPGLPVAGDVSDWLDAGGTVDGLLAFAADPPPTEPGVIGDDRDDSDPAMAPTPFQWLDATAIPPREWVYDTHLIRKFVSLTVSPGGLGKSSLALVEAMSMAANQALLKDATVHEPDLRVWYWNGEDPQEETQRRVIAAAKHYGLAASDFAPRLFTDTGREMTLTLGSILKGEIALDEDLFLSIEQAMLTARIDVLILDPFVSAHRLGENDNNAIDAVIKRLGKLADRTNAAVEIVHHVRKPSSSDAVTDVNDARGASALIGGVRSARVLNVMPDDIAGAAGISSDIRRRYFSVTDGKSNMSARGAEPAWRYLESINLDNKTDKRPSDNVGVVTYYALPKAAQTMADLSSAEDEMRLILSADDTVRHWSGKGRGNKPKNWLGHRILDVLKIHDRDHDAAIQRLIMSWVQEGKVVTRTAWMDKNQQTFLALPTAPYEASYDDESPENLPF